MSMIGEGWDLESNRSSGGFLDLVRYIFQGLL